MEGYVARGALKVAAELAAFVEGEVLSGLPLAPDTFWRGLDETIHGLTPENRALLDRRAELQAALDGWHRARAGRPHDAAAYRAFLEEIGYLEPEPAPFAIETRDVDAEIAEIAGPQLVTPILNPRFALNAANARWGSLYDALYATDALGAPPPMGALDPGRADAVRARVRALLDETLPLDGASWAQARGFAVVDGALAVRLEEGAAKLAAPAAFAGHAGPAAAPTSVVLRRHGLHLELRIDAESQVGRLDPAGVADVLLESAPTAIMDLEDSIAAVDAADKTDAYRIWLRLMKGTLSVEVTRGGRVETRRMAQDRDFTAPGGGPLSLRGRTLMLIRTVGHLMTTPAVLDRDGAEAFEGIVDAAIVALIAMHDRALKLNSRFGSVYIVKPKMHGPAEVAFADRLFARVEDFLGLPRATLKMGVMDEERRTTLNLRACIAAAKTRLVFINTGFLDRTGDEIRTAMEAGPMVRKADMKAERWIAAYEDWNVDAGLACGLRGRAQIGKGMWAMPDAMAAMLRDKIAHPAAGATCAWVPGPAAATLHATHYLRVDVAARQGEIAAHGPRASRDDLLAIPLARGANWSDETARAEIENNLQGVLGYVVRWVDQGVGCSKVPDIHDVGLMEDRATCRISSQHVANWLRHGVVTVEEVEAALRRMAEKVDAQNAGDPSYRPMAPGFDGPAFRAARALVFEALAQPSGYTEPLLHRWRAIRKAMDAAAGAA